MTNVPLKVAGFSLPRGRRVNLTGGNNNGNAAAAARRAENERKRRASLNRNRNARELAAVQARVQAMREKSNAELARKAKNLANRLTGSNASQSEARKFLTKLRHNPAAIRRISLVALVSLFVLAGHAIQAFRIIASSGGNNALAKNRLKLTLNQRVGR